MSPLPRLTGMRALVICLTLVLLAGPAAADVMKVGDRLAELDVAVDEAGKSFKLKSLKGKWVLVTIGAGWCKPCKKELPTWDKVAGGHKGKISFVALSVDDEIADGKRFHKKLKIQHMLKIYMPQEKSGVAASYGASTMPTTFIADPQGVVRWVKAGFEERDPDGEAKKLRAAIAKLVK